MPETEAKKKWMKENTIFVGLKLNRNTDREILEWLDQQPSKQGAIKKAITYYLERFHREG